MAELSERLMIVNVTDGNEIKHKHSGPGQ